jgi:tetratricopeptide (TPR) repeat protein
MSLAHHTAGWLALPLAALFHASFAHAQAAVQPYAAPPQAQVYRQTPGDDLARYLNMLGDDPNSIPALTGAGKAALELGDGEAALNFFGRADVLSPQDATIKAGIASGLVLMEQAQASMPLFDEAQRLGYPVGDMAGYRGLAYDLMGDPARAQQDYRLALRRRDDPEVRRRLALSLAIGGQRDAALATIDDQLRRQDRAAWRVRAFILALTGDAQGANRVVESVMPYQAAAMAPFLARLPSLSLADRALAVHFGHFPGDSASTASQTTVLAQTAPVRTDPVTSAGQPDFTQRPLGQAVAPAPNPVLVPAATGAQTLANVRAAQTPPRAAPTTAVPLAPPLAPPAVVPGPAPMASVPRPALTTSLAPSASVAPLSSAPNRPITAASKP